MRIPRMFYDGILEVGRSVDLDKEQVHYLGRVLRLKPERQLVLFNGLGGEYLCQISNLDTKQGVISVLVFQDPHTESPLNICLALGLSKGYKFDWAIQKATELGVTSIQPLTSQRTEVRLVGDRLEKKLCHWQGVIRSATEQSGRTRVPDLLAPLSISEYLGKDEAKCKLLLDPEASVSLSENEQLLRGASSVSLVVGPEGGLDEQEIGLAKSQGYLCTHMGPRVMRTETAPIAALAVIQSHVGGW